MQRRMLLDAAKFAVVALIFILLYRSGRIDLNTLGLALEKPWIVFAAYALGVIGISLTVARWQILLKAVDISVGFSPAFVLTLIGAFFSVALPGAIGGDIIKAYYLARGQSEKAALVTTIIFDRFLGLYTVTLVAAVAGASAGGYILLSGEIPAWWGPSSKGLIIFITSVFLIFTAGAAIFTSRRVGESRLFMKIIVKLPFHDKILKIYKISTSYKSKPGFVARATALSLFSQFAGYGSIWMLASAVEIKELTLANYLFAIPVCILINAIPLSPSGLGVGELGFGAVFAMFGSAKGVELAVLYHAVSISFSLVLGGAAYLIYSRKQKVAILTRILNQDEDDSLDAMTLNPASDPDANRPGGPL